MGKNEMEVEKEVKFDESPPVEHSAIGHSEANNQFSTIAPPIKKFSKNRGRTPNFYIPAWKTNVPFRKLDINLAKEYDVHHSTHGNTLFLNKRERLEETVRTEVTEPERQLRYPPNSHLSKYNSSLLHRKRYV